MSENQLFTQLQKTSAESFHQQKRLIKQVLAGHKVLCPGCQQAITVKRDQQAQQLQLTCVKRCTDILLDL